MVSLDILVGIRPNGHLVPNRKRLRRPAAARQYRCRIGLDLPLDYFTGVVRGFDLDVDVRVRPAEASYRTPESYDRFSIENGGTVMPRSR